MTTANTSPSPETATIDGTSHASSTRRGVLLALVLALFASFAWWNRPTQTRFPPTLSDEQTRGVPPVSGYPTSSSPHKPHPTVSLQSSTPLPSFNPRVAASLPSTVKYDVYRSDRCILQAHTPQPRPAAAQRTLLTARSITCPPPPSPPSSHASDDVSSAPPEYFQQRPEWVFRQYSGYAKKCSKKQGVMWRRLSVAAHRQLTTRMYELAAGAATYASPRAPIALLDWASGCGADVAGYRDVNADVNRSFFGLGIDLIGGAVEWANKHSASLAVRSGHTKDNTAKFCHADGSKLDWIPSNTFDAVTSMGGLAHLPSATICPTVEALVRVVRPGWGRVVSCYMHPAATAQHFVDCRINCGVASANFVKVSFFNMNDFAKGADGWTEGYTKVNATCIVWEKL